MNTFTVEFEFLKCLVLRVSRVCHSKYVVCAAMFRRFDLPQLSVGKERQPILPFFYGLTHKFLMFRLPQVAISTVLYSDVHTCAMHLEDTILFSFVACFVPFRCLMISNLLLCQFLCVMTVTMCSGDEHFFTAGEDLYQVNFSSIFPRSIFSYTSCFLPQLFSKFTYFVSLPRKFCQFFCFIVSFFCVLLPRFIQIFCSKWHPNRSSSRTLQRTSNVSTQIQVVSWTTISLLQRHNNIEHKCSKTCCSIMERLDK